MVAAEMAVGGPTRRRRLAILVTFAVGVIATAATSQPVTFVDVPSATATTHLDAAHPASLTRLLVRLPPEATTGNDYPSFSVRVLHYRPAVDAGVDVLDPAGMVRVIVASSLAMASGVPDESAPPYGVTGATAWQAEMLPGRSVGLPIECGIGPCERSFWLIAQLTDPGGPALDVDWEASGELSYSGSTWPSDATASIEFGPTTAVAGPAPAVAVSTETETLTLGPARPAAARVVELGIGAEAIPSDGRALGVVSVDILRSVGGGYSSAQPVLIQLYPLDGEAPLPPSGPPPPAPASEAPMADGADPFASCQVGAPCTRRVLVTFAWTGATADEVTIDWRLTVRRVDLADVWTTPAELSAVVTRRLDLDTDTAATRHLEGAASTVHYDGVPQVQLALSSSTSSSDPIAALLPVPAVMAYRSQLDDAGPTPSGATPGVQLGITGYRTTSTTDGAAELTTNPAMNGSVACLVGATCPDVSIRTIISRDDPNAPAPSLPFHWSVDLRTYSYTDIPIDLTARDVSPG